MGTNEHGREYKNPRGALTCQLLYRTSTSGIQTSTDGVQKPEEEEEEEEYKGVQRMGMEEEGEEEEEEEEEEDTWRMEGGSRRIEALTDQSWKHMAFFALRNSCSVVRLRTVSSYEKFVGTQWNSRVFYPGSEKRRKGERYTDSSYTTDSHANTGIHAFVLPRVRRGEKGERNTDPSYNIESHCKHIGCFFVSYSD